MPYGSRLAAAMTRRLGRECVYTPSARLALYLALRRWCRPPVWRSMRRLGLLERDDFRMALHAPRLTGSAREAPSLTAYEPWVRVDLHDFRARHGALLRGQLGLRPARLDGDLDRRRAGVAALARSAWSSPALRALSAHDGLVPLFRVPLLVHDRDALVERLVDHGVVAGYVYDPPLDDYADPEFTDPSADPAAARWFASHVLPADPLLARRIIHALTKERAAPARPPLTEPVRDTAPPAPLGQ